jgi:hypothetical protein
LPRNCSSSMVRHCTDLIIRAGQRTVPTWSHEPIELSTVSTRLVQ